MSMPESHANELIPYETWESCVDELAAAYSGQDPFPHIHLQDFLNPDVARRVADDFPTPGGTKWIQYKHYNENKLGQTDRKQFPPTIQQVMDELLSDRFVAWLSRLTGIPDLHSDPSLEGGGMHQTETGGFLNVHADFTMHHHQKNWRRRCNLILYLNDGWQDEWGGSLELWDRSMHACVAKYPPLLNHAVIFNTDEDSYHGYPGPIGCPPEVTRNSLALYYYTIEPEHSVKPRSTNYRATPGDGALRRLCIWSDKTLLRIYSRAKQAFGLSDNFASSLLGLFSRKRRK